MVREPAASGCPEGVIQRRWVDAAAAAVTIFIAYNTYIRRKDVPLDAAQLTGVQRVVGYKFYIDELYNAIIVIILKSV